MMKQTLVQCGSGCTSCRDSHAHPLAFMCRTDGRFLLICEVLERNINVCVCVQANSPPGLQFTAAVIEFTPRAILISYASTSIRKCQ